MHCQLKPEMEKDSYLHYSHVHNVHLLQSETCCSCWKIFPSDLGVQIKHLQNMQREHLQRMHRKKIYSSKSCYTLVSETKNGTNLAVEV